MKKPKLYDTDKRRLAELDEQGSIAFDAIVRWIASDNGLNLDEEDAADDVNEMAADLSEYWDEYSGEPSIKLPPELVALVDAHYRIVLAIDEINNRPPADLEVEAGRLSQLDLFGRQND